MELLQFPFSSGVGNSTIFTVKIGNLNIRHNEYDPPNFLVGFVPISE